MHARHALCLFPRGVGVGWGWGAWPATLRWQAHSDVHAREPSATENTKAAAERAPTVAAKGRGFVLRALRVLYRTLLCSCQTCAPRPLSNSLQQPLAHVAQLLGAAAVPHAGVPARPAGPERSERSCSAGLCGRAAGAEPCVPAPQHCRPPACPPAWRPGQRGALTCGTQEVLMNRSRVQPGGH